MDKKIFMTEQGMATISCPECQNTVTKCIGEHELIDKVKKINCSCSCGHSFKVIIEKRQFFRKGTHFSGKYKYCLSDGSEKYGLLYVLDVSQSGLRFKINIEPVFNVGDQIWVEFYIDKEGNRLVRKEGIIRGIRGQNIGMEFLTTEHYDEFGKLLLR
jgi:hypothetical protein